MGYKGNVRYAMGLMGAIFVFATACQQPIPGKRKRHGKNHQATQKMVVDTLKPLAVFTDNMEDAVTDNDFSVKVFATGKTDIYRAMIRYGGNEVHDEIDMLPREYYKRIVLKPGAEHGQCIIGFDDPQGKFNEMKLITASGTRIGIKTLRAYYLTNQ